MKMRFLVVSALVVWSLSVPGVLPAQETEEGFVSLFNGQNLDGWVIENGEEKAFVVQDGLIFTPGEYSYPLWLRSEKEYENFDLRFEFRMDGWCNSGVFFHAPRHGRVSRIGFEYQIDHKTKEPLSVKTCGAVFSVVPPTVNRMGERGEYNNEWNTGRIVMDWPNLQFWLNDDPVQNINVEDYPELKYRFRQGFIGLQAMGYDTWFRNIRIRELPGEQKWVSLFNGKDLTGWYQEGKGALWEVKDGAIHAHDGTSYQVTEGEYEDFALQCFIRSSPNANGGIFLRWKTLEGGDRGNEIQIENTPDSNYPTGSLYNFARAEQAHYRDGEWMPMQIFLKGPHLVIRVNGETVVDVPDFPTVRKGHISLQMHSSGWIEFKDILIQPL